MLNDIQYNNAFELLVFGKQNVTEDDIAFLKEHFEDIAYSFGPSAQKQMMRLINDKTFVKDRIINSKDINIYTRIDMIEGMDKCYQLEEHEYIDLLAEFLSANKDDISSKEKCDLIFGKCYKYNNSTGKFEFNIEKFRKFLFHTLIELDKKEEAQIAIASCNPLQIIHTFSKFDGIIASKHLENLSREEFLDSIRNIINRREELGLEYVENHILQLVQMAKDYKREENDIQDDKDYRFFLRSILYNDKNQELFLNKNFTDLTIPLILSSGSDTFIKEIIQSNDYFNIYGYQSVELLTEYKDEELIESILKGETDAKLDYQDRGKLAVFLIERNLVSKGISRNKANEIKAKAYEDFLKNPDLKLYDSDISYIVAQSNSERLIKKAIEEKMVKCEFEVADLLCILKDKDYVKKYLDKHREEMDINNVETLIYSMHDKSAITQFEQKIRTVKNISELSIEELKKLPDDLAIKIDNDNNSDRQKCLYSKKEFIKIKEKLNEMLDGIEPAKKDDKESELTTFLRVYKRLADNIIYDDYAISDEGEKDQDLATTCRTLKCLAKPGDLIKCVCAGYADILSNALAEKGIEARYVKGFPQRGAGHAWNQVKIGGQWFNVDLTSDRREVASKDTVTFDVLKADEEFKKDHGEYSKRRSKEYECAMPASKVFADIDDVAISKRNFDIGMSVKKIGRRFRIGYNEIVHTAKELKDRLLRRENKDIENHDIN